MGQRIMFTGSDDFVHWMNRKFWLNRTMWKTASWIPSGFYVNGDRLIVYYLKFSYRPEVLKQGQAPDGQRGPRLARDLV